MPNIWVSYQKTFMDYMANFTPEERQKIADIFGARGQKDVHIGVLPHKPVQHVIDVLFEQSQRTDLSNLGRWASILLMKLVMLRLMYVEQILEDKVVPYKVALQAKEEDEK